LWDILKVQSFISVFVTGNADTGEEVNTKSLTNPNKQLTLTQIYYI